MAYTLAYRETNGVTVTAGDTFQLTVNVYKMKSDYSFELIITDEVIATDESYDIVYTADGVYKITILENAIMDTYVDINYCTYMTIMSTLTKQDLCCNPSDCDDSNDKDYMSLVFTGLRFFAQDDYTINATTTIDATVQSELEDIYDAIDRVSEYSANIDTAISCCTN